MDSPDPKCVIKEMYYYELERKASIEGSLSLPLGVIFVLAGALWYMIKNAPVFGYTVPHILFYLFLSFLAVGIIFAVYFIIRAVWSYSYGYVMSPQELVERLDELKQYYLEQEGYWKKKTGKAIDVLAREYLDDDLHSHYIEAGQMNWEKNNSKSKYRHSMYKSIVVSVAFLLAALVPYLAITLPDRNNVQKIEIVNTSKPTPTPVKDKTNGKR